MSCQFSINICPFPVDGKYGQSCKYKGAEESCPMRKAGGCLKVPTFAECLGVYSSRTDVRRKTKDNVRSGVLNSLELLNISPDSPYTVMTRIEFNQLKTILKERLGYDDYTVLTRFTNFRSLGADDLGDEYERLGWQRPLFDTPKFKPEVKEVQDMTDDQAFRIEDKMTTFRLSPKESDRTKFIAIWFIHRFAVRNGDINNMKWKNIEMRENGWYLVYTPNKTAKYARRLPPPKIDGRAKLEIEPFIGDPEDYCIPRHPEKSPKTGNFRTKHEDSIGSHTRMWRDINSIYRSVGIGTQGKPDKKSYCSRKRRITEAFAYGGFQEAIKFGKNTPNVQMRHYIGQY